MESERPTLTPLWVLWPPKPNRWLVVPLACTVGLYVASMRLVWHHHVIPAAGFTPIYGIQGASWLLVSAALAAMFAVRFFVEPAGGYSKFLLVFLAFLTTLGVYADYVDAQTRAAQLNLPAYFGPGFYVGLAGTAALIVSVVLVLRD